MSRLSGAQGRQNILPEGIDERALIAPHVVQRDFIKAGRQIFPDPFGMLRQITRYPDRFIKVIGPRAGRRGLELSGRTELPSCVPLDEIRAPLAKCI